MGSTFTVSAWGKHFDNEYSYKVVYSGENLLKAYWAQWRSKRKGFGCVKMEWR